MWSTTRHQDAVPDDEVGEEPDRCDTVLLGVAFLTMAIVVIVAAMY